MKRTSIAAPPAKQHLRCAIYTRKSSEEGLDQEFNSLDAQRESGEAFIKSQAHESWECLPTRYDDGGYTGGNIERPALKRLLADIDAGMIDIVVCYKVDRLSRSLLDFTRMMETFEKHQVWFCAFTQQINTANSMGRLMLNVLMSFAQFERELVSERTRDKVAAARRKGKWAGGHPILGYDIDPRGFKLVVNDDEAVRVRTIFDLYLDLQSLIPVVQELERRGWRNKQWTTRKGPLRGGNPFTKTSLHSLLTNPAYIGKVRYKSEIHVGEHAGIVDSAVWQRVQSILQRNALTGGATVRNRFGALLKGLLRCVPCGSAMVPTHTTRHGNKRYRYYVCCGAQKRGWHTCPSKAIPAGEIESLVLDKIRCIGRDQAVLEKTIAQARIQIESRTKELNAEKRQLSKDLAAWQQQLTSRGQSRNGSSLADLQERIRNAEMRLTTINEEILALEQQVVDERDVAKALSAFDPIWESLTPREQVRIVQMLVQQVNYDGNASKVAITFHPTGIKALAGGLPEFTKEKIA